MDILSQNDGIFEHEKKADYKRIRKHLKVKVVASSSKVEVSKEATIKVKIFSCSQ